MKSTRWIVVVALGWSLASGCVYKKTDDDPTDCVGESCSSGGSIGAGASGGNGGSAGSGVPECTAQLQAEVLQRIVSYHTTAPLPAACVEALPSGFTTASLEPGYAYEYYVTPPTSITAEFSSSGLVSVDGVPCEPVFPNMLSQTFDQEDCAQMFICGCCGFELELYTPGTWMLQAHSTYCTAQYTSNDYYVGGHPFGNVGGSGGVGGSSGSGSGGSCNFGDNCCGCGYPFCDGACAGCC